MSGNSECGTVFGVPLNNLVFLAVASSLSLDEALEDRFSTSSAVSLWLILLPRLAFWPLAVAHDPVTAVRESFLDCCEHTVCLAMSLSTASYLPTASKLWVWLCRYYGVSYGPFAAQLKPSNTRPGHLRLQSIAFFLTRAGKPCDIERLLQFCPRVAGAQA